LQEVESNLDDRLFRSATYEVRVRALTPGADRIAAPESMSDALWLIVARRDGRATVDWRHLQRIKSEVCGLEREGCELFPAESRLVDSHNVRHLWVLAEGEHFWFGWHSGRVITADSPTWYQRPFEPDDYDYVGDDEDDAW